MGLKPVDDHNCSVARALTVLGERWTLLILREALTGTTRYADFERKLGVPPDTLADRLSTLVCYGIMTRESYQEPGQRTRPSYHLTDSGRQLHVVIGALSDWGDNQLPREEGPSMSRTARRTGRAVHVGFVDELGYEIHHDDVAIYAAEDPDEDIAVTRPVGDSRVDDVPVQAASTPAVTATRTGARKQTSRRRSTQAS